MSARDDYKLRDLLSRLDAVLDDLEYFQSGGEAVTDRDLCKWSRVVSDAVDLVQHIREREIGIGVAS